MVSDKYMLNSDSGRMAAARYVTEGFARRARLDRQNELRLVLLVEETLGMVKSMVDDFYGQMWFVGDEKACEIHLQATANMDSDRRRELLSVSSSGKNAARRGFMAMLGEYIANTIHNIGDAMDTAYGQSIVQYGVIPGGMDTPNLYDLTPMWTLQKYRADLEQGQAGSGETEAALDELEKSIVANLADDVVVGVKGDTLEMVIVKRFDK